MSVDTAQETVTLTIDGIEVTVPKGTLAIRAAEALGIAIPRFCDHPLLDPVGACRQCMVEIPDAGNGRAMPKPQASCTIAVADGMKIKTQITSAQAEKAQRGMLEMLLINHPLDCPICDKGGECPLQNQAMSNGPGESRFHAVKRTFPKPVSISSLVLLDRERCVLCARCTRFSEQISGDPFITLVERGALQQVGIYSEQPYSSVFSGNVIQICPVGALTSTDYRFKSRPFDLVSTDTTCEHCAAGCALRSDHRNYQVERRLAGDDPQVNEEWNCDKGRFGFTYARGDDRLTRPLVRENGVLVQTSWHEAIDAAVAGLRAAGDQVGVLTGGRLLLESAYAYSRFARTVLRTNNIDCRARQLSAEETAFLSSSVAGRSLDDSVTYQDLENARTVVLVDFEPEDESPIVFLRLRKAVRKNNISVVSVAPFLSRGAQKLDANLVPCRPLEEGAALQNLVTADGETVQVDSQTIVLVGERAAAAPGALSAVARLTADTGCRMAWIPRRAGEVGALEAGCLPTLLPGGRLVNDVRARIDMQAEWNCDRLSDAEGMDAETMLAAARDGGLRALVVAGMEPSDMADRELALAGLEAAEFVVSFEQRTSQVTERASVVFPVALVEEQSGHFVDWEHRERRVNVVNKANTSPMTDIRALAALADAMGVELGIRNASQAKAEMDELVGWDGVSGDVPQQQAPTQLASSELVLASWRPAVDPASAGLDHQQMLHDAAPPARIVLSPGSATLLGVGDEQRTRVVVGAAELELEVVVEPTMLDGVAWVPGIPGAAGQPVVVQALVAGGVA